MERYYECHADISYLILKRTVVSSNRQHARPMTQYRRVTYIEKAWRPVADHVARPMTYCEIKWLWQGIKRTVEEQETNLMSQFVKFYFASSMLSMFRTLIHPSSGACDFSIVSPHWLCVLVSMCVGVSVSLGWCHSKPSTPKLQHTSNQEQYDQCGNSTE